MIPEPQPPRPTSLSILHVCGDDPKLKEAQSKVDTVFSTYVEMIPISQDDEKVQASILHVCGDDPQLRQK